MSTRESFYEFVMDQMSSLRGVSMRKMFGGAGLYRDGVIFGVVVEDTFYLKADESNRGDFEAAGMGPWSYDGTSGKQTIMPYYQVPPDVLDDRERLAGWARKAQAVAAKKPTKPTPAKAAKAAPAKRSSPTTKAAKPSAKAKPSATKVKSSAAKPKARARSK